MLIKNVLLPPVDKKIEAVIIPQKKVTDFKINLLKRSMDKFEMELLEERISIMVHSGNIPEEEAETLATKDIISLRDNSGLAGAIVNILGAVELKNEEINIHKGLR